MARRTLGRVLQEGKSLAIQEEISVMVQFRPRRNERDTSLTFEQVQERTAEQIVEEPQSPHETVEVVRLLRVIDCQSGQMSKLRMRLSLS